VVQSIPDLVTTAEGPGRPLTSRPTTAPREAIKAHCPVAQGSELHFRDRPALIVSGGQLLVTIVGEVAFSTGCGNSAGRCNSCRRGVRIDCMCLLATRHAAGTGYGGAPKKGGGKCTAQSAPPPARTQTAPSRRPGQTRCPPRDAPRRRAPRGRGHDVRPRAPIKGVRRGPQLRRVGAGQWRRRVAARRRVPRGRGPDMRPRAPIKGVRRGPPLRRVGAGQSRRRVAAPAAHQLLLPLRRTSFWPRVWGRIVPVPAPVVRWLAAGRPVRGLMFFLKYRCYRTSFFRFWVAPP